MVSLDIVTKLLPPIVLSFGALSLPFVVMFGLAGESQKPDRPSRVEQTEEQLLSQSTSDNRGSGRSVPPQESRQYSDNPTWEGAGTPGRTQGSATRLRKQQEPIAL